MEGGSVFGHGFLHNSPYFLRPAPPLPPLPKIYTKAIDFSLLPIATSAAKKTDRLVPSNGFDGFSFSATGGIQLPGLEDIKFVDALLVDDEPSNSVHETKEGILEEKSSKMGFRERQKKSSEKRAKRTFSPNVVKGQWSPNEDRLLIALVDQYGEKKWSQIAQKLKGRIGKQCRERWHNHLRPDIKKDAWSEEEERQLVEAHEKIGNKWSEIAKRIPGRTENAVKNYWNATKRRQNARRKIRNAKAHGAKSKPSILQDYIKSKIIEESSTITTSKTSYSTTPSIQSHTLPPQSLAFATDTSTSTTPSNESPLFPEKFQENVPTNVTANQTIRPTDEERSEIAQLENFLLSDDLFFNDEHQFVDMDYLDFFGSSTVTSSSPIIDGCVDNVPQKDLKTTTSTYITAATASNHMYSDLYLAYLLNGDSSSSTICENKTSLELPIEPYQASSNFRKEMDLIEMISSSQVSPGTSSSFW